MKEIDCSQLELKMKQPQILVIDVRERWEHEEECICEKNIPLPELPHHLDELAPYKGQEIIVHCQSGKRSRQAQKYLFKNGFKNVSSLAGGLQNCLSQ